MRAEPERGPGACAAAVEMQTDRTMNFFVTLLDALVRFVQRNPLTVLLILLLALGAPALLRGLALAILYVLLGLLIAAVGGLLLLRWRLYRIRRRMEESFGEGPQAGPGFWQSFGAGSAPRGREGDVRVHRTSGTPEKRVAKDVGDYVDFEEEKN